MAVRQLSPLVYDRQRQLPLITLRASDLSITPSSDGEGTRVGSTYGVGQRVVVTGSGRNRAADALARWCILLHLSGGCILRELRGNRILL